MLNNSRCRRVSPLKLARVFAFSENTGGTAEITILRPFYWGGVYFFALKAVILRNGSDEESHRIFVQERDSSLRSE